MAVMFSNMTAFAQSLTEGFYRVQNNGSQRYLYVKDCTGDVSTLGADMDAIELWPNLDAAISDPGSVMYLEKHDNAWDITSQATGVYEMTNRYMSISYDGKFCQVYNSGQYLYEIGTSMFNPQQGRIGAKTTGEMPGKSQFRLWNATKIDSNSDNYFGFKPTVKAGTKNYAPFYADFAYTPKAAVKTWYVSQVDKEHAIAVIKQIEGTVARSQAVFVECVSASPADNKVDLTAAAGNKAAGNQMVGVFFDNGSRSGISHKGKNPAVTVFDPKTMRLLGTNSEGKLSFENKSSTLVNLEICENGSWDIYKDCIPHNTSYLKVDADCPASLTVMTEAEYKEYIDSLTPPEPTYIIGDVNGDGRVSIADVPSLIMFIIHGDTTGLNEKAADVNGDGRVSIADAPTLVDKIVNKK